MVYCNFVLLKGEIYFVNLAVRCNFELYLVKEEHLNKLINNFKTSKFHQYIVFPFFPNKFTAIVINF